VPLKGTNGCRSVIAPRYEREPVLEMASVGLSPLHVNRPPPTADGGSPARELAYTLRTHAVRRHQQVVAQSLPSELHDSTRCRRFGTIKGVGLSGIVTDTDSHVRMERANRCGRRRQAHAARPTLDCRHRCLHISEPPVSRRCRIHAARASKSEVATLFTGCEQRGATPAGPIALGRKADIRQAADFG
jgi:hypothetical protein